MFYIATMIGQAESWDRGEEATTLTDLEQTLITRRTAGENCFVLWDGVEETSADSDKLSLTKQLLEINEGRIRKILLDPSFTIAPTPNHPKLGSCGSCNCVIYFGQERGNCEFWVQTGTGEGGPIFTGDCPGECGALSK